MASKQVNFNQVLMIALATTIVSALLSWVFVSGKLAALEQAIKQLEEKIMGAPKERPIIIAGGSVELGFDDSWVNIDKNKWKAEHAKIKSITITDKDGDDSHTYNLKDGKNVTITIPYMKSGSSPKNGTIIIKDINCSTSSCVEISIEGNFPLRRLRNIGLNFLNHFFKKKDAVKMTGFVVKKDSNTDNEKCKDEDEKEKDCSSGSFIDKKLIQVEVESVSRSPSPSSSLAPGSK